MDILYALIYSSGDISNSENLVKTEVVANPKNHDIFRTECRIVIRHIFLESAKHDLQNDIHTNGFCKSQIVIQ